MDKEHNKKILSELETLFSPLEKTKDKDIFLGFLEKYLIFLDKLPEFFEIKNEYGVEEKKDLNEFKKINDKIAKTIEPKFREVMQYFSSKNKFSILRRIKDYINDKEKLRYFNLKLITSEGINEYVILKDFANYIRKKKYDPFSFAYGMNDLCLDKNYEDFYEESRRININGKPWSVYKQIINEIKKPFDTIDLDNLKKNVEALNEDIKQKLIIEKVQEAKKEEKKPIPLGVHFEQPEGSKYYILTGLGNKPLRFKDKEEDIRVLFQFYYDNHGLFVNNEEAYNSVKNPERTFINMMTSLKGTIRRQGFNKIIKLKGTGMGTYILEIIINN